MRPDTTERLLQLMADVLDTDPSQLTATAEADDIPDWDSLRTIHLATAIEAEFEIVLEPEQIANLQSVPQILALLEAKGCG